ncbi:MAG TPA: hypothetical protein VKH65_03240 [Myxococcales bacterium]|nr:MAG: hypothetical protein E6J64_04365 [Deltaproteobacteria bacterium]HMC33392.1 hypothetical protein [Myxococcales bacterium]
MSSDETPRLCKFLRAKTSGVHGDPGALWAIRNDSSAIYWCLLTMSPAGPDDRLVHVCDCGEERVCCIPAGEPPSV